MDRLVADAGPQLKWWWTQVSRWHNKTWTYRRSCCERAGGRVLAGWPMENKSTHADWSWSIILTCEETIYPTVRSDENMAWDIGAQWWHVLNAHSESKPDLTPMEIDIPYTRDNHLDEDVLLGSVCQALCRSWFIQREDNSSCHKVAHDVGILADSWDLRLKVGIGDLVRKYHYDNIIFFINFATCHTGGTWF